MSLRRPSAPRLLVPDLDVRARPAASGEYRIVKDAQRRSSSTTTSAVRPETRRASSGTALPAVRVVPPPVTGATPSPTGPCRYDTVEMQAIKPTQFAGRELDELDFDFDIDADGALELDSLPFTQSTRVETPRPTMHEAPPARLSGQARLALAEHIARTTPSPMPRMKPGPMLPPAPPWPMASSMGQRLSSTAMAAVDPHAALVAFSGFGDPPASVFGAPAYAARVIVRRRRLQRDLELARLRRSPDVGLYEASLRTADDTAVRNGVILAALFFTMMTLLAWTAVRVLRGTYFVGL